MPPYIWDALRTFRPPAKNVGVITTAHHTEIVCSGGTHKPSEGLENMVSGNIVVLIEICTQAKRRQRTPVPLFLQQARGIGVKMKTTHRH